MTTHRRRAAFLAALVVTLAVPAGAHAAPPVSTYTLEFDTNPTGMSVAVDLTVAESGVGHVDLTATEVVLYPCGGAVGSTITRWTAVNSDATPSMFEVDRKLSQFTWSGSAAVTVLVTEFCPGTATIQSTSVVSGVFEFSGTSSERLNRNRVNGDRVLTSTLDSLTVSTPVWSGTAAGVLTEVISQG